MVAMADPKKPVQHKPPADAKAFVIFRVGTAKHDNSKGGTRTRMKGPPLDDGTVPDIWPIGEFSTQRVLAMWGPGHYRVDFYDGDDNLMRGQGYLFDVATPLKKNRSDRKLRPETDDGPAEPQALAAAAAGGLGLLDVLTLLREGQRDADRRADAQAERDRQFFAAQQQSQTALLTVLLGNRSPSVDPDVLRREMNLSVAQGMLGIRQELFQRQRQEAEEDEPDDPDPGDPPADLEEAASRIGLAFFQEIEQNAPHLLRELVPTVVEWLKPRGFQPSATLQQQIAQTLRQRNGTAHADPE